jgi:hypothetical protein
MKTLAASLLNKRKLKVKHKSTLKRWEREFFSNSTRKLQEELRALKRSRIILTSNNNGKKRK